MGSKRRLLPWIHGVLSELEFQTAADPFLGSGCVAYLLKTMGKRVTGSDFLNFPVVLSLATVANNSVRLERETIERLLSRRKKPSRFIEKTFAGIFFEAEDLKFLDRVSGAIGDLKKSEEQAIARAALIRSCLKKQPRGVFTVSGDLSRYDDGRRDLRLSIEEHFYEQIAAFDDVVFDNGHSHSVHRADVLDTDPAGIDLVYLDPPYVPRADDNCYVKRYHFLEGLSCYWEGLPIMEDTKVKKIQKKYTPFSYRKTAVQAFDDMFRLYRDSIIVLSYSSNGFPDLDILEGLMRKYKRHVVTHQRPHRYHFGTHSRVSRSEVNEYLIVGSS